MASPCLYLMHNNSVGDCYVGCFRFLGLWCIYQASLVSDPMGSIYMKVMPLKISQPKKCSPSSLQQLCGVVVGNNYGSSCSTFKTVLQGQTDDAFAPLFAFFETYYRFNLISEHICGIDNLTDDLSCDNLSAFLQKSNLSATAVSAIPFELLEMLMGSRPDWISQHWIEADVQRYFEQGLA